MAQNPFFANKNKKQKKLEGGNNYEIFEIFEIIDDDSNIGTKEKKSKNIDGINKNINHDDDYKNYTNVINNKMDTNYTNSNDYSNFNLNYNFNNNKANNPEIIEIDRIQNYKLGFSSPPSLSSIRPLGGTLIMYVLSVLTVTSILLY